VTDHTLLYALYFPKNQVLLVHLSGKLKKDILFFTLTGIYKFVIM